MKREAKAELEALWAALQAVIVQVIRERLLGGAQSNGDRPKRAAQPRPRTGRKKPTFSPAIRALQKLQGLYAGTFRHLAPADQARVSALRKAKGIRPAITLARQLKKKKATPAARPRRRPAKSSPPAEGVTLH